MTSIEGLRQEIIRLRAELNQLERSRQADGGSSPPETWEKLVLLSRQLEDAEDLAVSLSEGITREVNRTRESILEKLGLYQQWWKEQAEMEAHFLACVVRPGYQLKMAVQQREYLEKELRRIQRGIAVESYPDRDSLEDDIRSVLLQNQQAYESPPASQEEEFDQPVLFAMDWEVDDMVDGFLRENLEREFRRIVLPAVHPDTSTTPVEIFHTIHEVYQNRDYLLMEAYLVQFRGPVHPDPDISGLECLDEILEVQEEYQQLETRLDRRISRIQKELTPQEMNDPEKLRQDLEARREEIIARLQDEAVIIQKLLDQIRQIGGAALNSGEGMK